MAQATDEKAGDDLQWRSVQRGGPASEPEGGHCEYCSSNGIACSFAPKVQGPPQTYVEALELRLETTQELLRNLSTSAGVDLVSLAHHPSGPDSAQKLQQAIRALQQTESDRNNAPFGLPPPQQYHPPSRRLQGVLDGRFAGRSAGPTLAAQVLDDHCEGATIQTEEQISLVEHLIVREQDQVSSASFALPPVELVELLVNSYFSQFNEQMPVLHRPSFSRALSGGLVNSDSAFRSLLFVVLALGARWVKDPRLRGDWSANALYGASCCEVPVGEHASPGSTLFDLQASTLAVVYLLGAETSVQAWSTGGLAMRKFIDVGAHLESTERWTQSAKVDQLRKRAFHMLFTLDRFCSASLGRPLAIRDFDFDLRHPIAIDDDVLDRWDSKPLGTPSPAPSQHLSGLFEHFSKIAAILGRTLEKLYSVRAASLTPQEMDPIVKELTAEHEACLAAVPEHLTWEYSGADSLVTLVGRATLRGSSCAAKLSMIRPLILRVARARDSSLDLLEGAFVLGGHATRTWNNIMRVLLDRDRVHQCFFWIPGSAGYACVVAFHILRSLLVSGRYLLSVTEGLHTAIRALQKLKDSTPEAAWCFESCKMLAQHVNRWRAAEKFDYSSFLLSPDPAPIAAYLAIPPFCYDDATAAAVHDQSASDLNPHPREFIDLPQGSMNDLSSRLHGAVSPFDALEGQGPIRSDHYPFRKEDWVDLIGDSFPVFSQDLLLGNEHFEWPDEWPALDTQWPQEWVQGL